ncbi:DUF4136 domain-containing protein [Sphingomonas antarctica]|uniref:hypothetical protein n=1 Tax=Sphingomonas antarctica TaxID=2040274 RepID=UPI0039E76EDE
MIKLFAVSALALSITAPAIAKKPPEISGLELQQIQAKDFEATKRVVFSSVMSVFQDSGYRIGSADFDTGLITASASTKTKMTWLPFVGFGTSKKTPVVSAYIEDRSPTLTKVRLTFVMGKFKNQAAGWGAMQDEEPINDPKVYQDAFEKINQAIFIRVGVDGPAQAPAPAIAPSPTPATSSTPTVANPTAH